MRTTVTTRARSPIGTLVGLTLVTAFLIIMGLYLITDGGFFTRLKEYAVIATARNGLTTLQENLKKYDRPQLITLYALMIVAGAAAVGAIGSFIRTNQYRFSVRQAAIEKRALWAYMPLCVLAWFLLTLLLMLCDKWAVSALLRGILGPGVYDKTSGWLLPALWLLVSGGLAAAVLWAIWRRVQQWLGRSLFVPGLRSRVPFSNVKRMEIQNSGEGSTILVLVLANGSHWTIQSGRLKRLQRLGAVLSRMLGLERRDFITWA